MSGNIKTIKFTATLSTIFLVLTYIIALNTELAFFVPNWPWMSNSFALTVCGGIFTSTLVVLLCEVQKYLSNKTSFENYLFYQAMYLYIQFFFIQRVTGEFIGNQEKEISETLVKDRVHAAQCQLNAIQSIDYTTFSSKNKLMGAQRDFCSVSIPKFNSFLSSVDNYLQIAIDTIQISNIKKFGLTKPVTTADPLVLQTLTVINKKSLSFSNDVSNFLKCIDCTCHYRFSWEVQKQKIHEGYISIFTAGKFEDFLKQGE